MDFHAQVVRHRGARGGAQGGQAVSLGVGDGLDDDHRPAAEARRLPAGREGCGHLRFRAEGLVGAAGQVVGGGVGSRVQRVAHAAVGPHRGHLDDAVVGLAQPAQPLPAHVRGPRNRRSR